MEQRKSKWSPELEKVLFDLVEKYVAKHYPIEEAFEKFEKMTDFTFGAIKQHWYMEMEEQKKEVRRFRNMRKNAVRDNQGEWDKEEDIVVIKCIKYCIKNGKSIREACKIAAKKTGRTRSACYTRWYGTLKNKKSVIRHIENYRQTLQEALI